MKKVVFLALVLLISLSLIIAGCGPEEEPGEKEPEKEEAVEEVDEMAMGEELIQDRCAECHGLDQVYTEKAEDEWPGIVDHMIEKSEGLLDDEEYDIVVDYLQENYSK